MNNQYEDIQAGDLIMVIIKKECGQPNQMGRFMRFDYLIDAMFLGFEEISLSKGALQKSTYFINMEWVEEIKLLLAH